MRRIEKQGKNSMIVPLVLALLIGASVSFFMKDWYDKNHSAQNKNVVRLTKQADDLLSGFIQLQNLNEQYAKMLSDKNLDPDGLKKLDSLNILITTTQVNFRKSLDSLQNKKGNYDENSYILLLKITDAYIAALTQSNSINTTRNSVNIGNTNYTFNQEMLSSMQNELQEKQMELISLGGGDKTELSSGYKKMMQQQDSVVTHVIQNQKQKNKNISDYNDKLKRDNERLSEQLQALQQSNATVQIKNNTSVTTTQLNEQLRLAQADCNLTRADARKIISNSKQRRDLLQQALEILNQLAQSGNQSVKEQAEAKLNELKTIAANNHD